MSIYETSITNPKKQLEFYKQLSEQLQQENKQLKIQISAREEVCNRLESNWNELKEWVKMEHREDAIVINLTWKHATGKFLDKMQELEGSDSNE